MIRDLTHKLLTKTKIILKYQYSQRLI